MINQHAVVGQQPFGEQELLEQTKSRFSIELIALVSPRTIKRNFCNQWITDTHF
jgi:hypothetical protein